MSYKLARISYIRNNFLVVLTICWCKLLNILFPHPCIWTMLLKMSRLLGCNYALCHSDRQIVKIWFPYLSSCYKQIIDSNLALLLLSKGKWLCNYHVCLTSPGWRIHVLNPVLFVCSHFARGVSLRSLVFSPTSKTHDVFVWMLSVACKQVSKCL